MRLDILFPLVPAGQAGWRAAAKQMAEPPREAGDGEAIGNDDAPLVQNDRRGDDLSGGLAVDLVLVRLVLECGVETGERLFGWNGAQDHRIPGAWFPGRVIPIQRRA